MFCYTILQPLYCCTGVKVQRDTQHQQHCALSNLGLYGLSSYRTTYPYHYDGAIPSVFIHYKIIVSIPTASLHTRFQMFLFLKNVEKLKHRRAFSLHQHQTAVINPVVEATNEMRVSDRYI